MSEPSAGITGLLPSALARRVDAACDRFESAWRAGGRPRIEDVLDDFPEAARPALLGALWAWNWPTAAWPESFRNRRSIGRGFRITPRR